MLKILVSTIVSLGISSFALAQDAGTEKAPAPTGTEMPKAEKTPAKAKKAHKKPSKKAE